MDSIELIQQHLQTVGKNSFLRHSDPKVFVAVKNVNWEQSGLIDTWSDVAQTVCYDWSKDGFDQYSPDWYAVGKPAFNKKLLELVTYSKIEHGINVFFSYLSGRLAYPETISRINSLGIITINISLDDSYNFDGDKEADGYTGPAAIAPEFDLCITTQRKQDTKKYLDIGARPLFLPPGGNPTVWAKYEVKPNRPIAVSFIGQSYNGSQRRETFDYLWHNGVPVLTAGKGWANGTVDQDEMMRIHHNSLIVLGFGYARGSETYLKGRDFEVPMTGTAYLTTWNKELAECFEPDKEIIFYRTKEELLEKIRYYTANPDEAKKIGAAGRARALKDHCWQDKWCQILEVCGDEKL